MIPFRWRIRDKTRTPIIRNEDIWEYAEMLVGDYRPSLLREPGPIPVEHFLESYLGASLDYQDIYFERGAQPIAGATVFNDERIRVFDREGQCTRVIEVSANTIIIDNSTVAAGNRGFAAFTGLHEGGHFTMHPEVYQLNPNQFCLFEPQKDGSGAVCCRRSSLSKRWCGKLTPEQYREHQANTFAAFTAMPRQTFIPLAGELIRKAGYRDGIFVDVETDWECESYLEKICNELAGVYGMSFTAVKIHLRDLGLLMNLPQYLDYKDQLAVSF